MCLVKVMIRSLNENKKYLDLVNEKLNGLDNIKKKVLVELERYLDNHLYQSTDISSLIPSRQLELFS